jgi:hypothetical protein
MPALTLTEMREPEETASRRESTRRWLAVSEPLAVDDDPDWEAANRDLAAYVPAVAYARS